MHYKFENNSLLPFFKAQRHRYNHLDLTHLEQILQDTQSCRRRMVVTDGVFSMDGDIAPLGRTLNIDFNW